MNYVTVLILITFLCNNAVCFSSSLEKFLQANAEYKKKNFEQSIALYQEIDNKGHIVWYNLGNCWYHSGNYSYAILNWKRALKYGGMYLNNFVTHNCSCAYQKLGINEEDSWSKPFLFFIARYSLCIFQIIFLIMLYFFLASAMYLYRKKQSFILGLLFFLMMGSGSCLAIKYWTTTITKAIIMKECSLMAGTDQRFTPLGELHTGQEVIIKETCGSWIKVQCNNHIGWILTENCEYI